MKLRIHRYIYIDKKTQKVLRKHETIQRRELGVWYNVDRADEVIEVDGKFFN